MNAPNRSTLLLLAAALGLSACASDQKSGSRPLAVQPVSNQAQMGHAIAWLDAGDAKSAKATLDAMLRSNPRDESAIILLETINRDPSELLGRQTFNYVVKPGDTMISLSQRFLGSSLKFYALARYNGIAVPSSLAGGATLRIPGEPPAAAPVTVAKPRSVKQRTAEPAASKPEAAPKLAAPASPAADPARATRLRGAGLAALNKGQVSTAVGLLRQAAASDPVNSLIRRDLDRAQRIRQTVKARR